MKQVTKLGLVLALCFALINLYAINKFKFDTNDTFTETKKQLRSSPRSNETFGTSAAVDEGETIQVTLPIDKSKPINNFVDTKHTVTETKETFEITAAAAVDEGESIINHAVTKTNETFEITAAAATVDEGKTIQVTLPIYNSKPNSGSMCHPDYSNGTGLELVTSHCRGHKCMPHSKDVDKSLLDLSFQDVNVTSDGKEGCKMLWFAAMHETEGMCDGRGHAYNVDYSIALNSFLANAKDVLQPVLILGRYGTKYENSTDPSKLALWAEERGVQVVYSSRLSFQEDVNKGLSNLFSSKTFSHLQGPFLRLDIPKFIKEHSLLDQPNICTDHVLYTDVDVIFSARFTDKDVQILQKSIGDGMLLYGREYLKRRDIGNTGVMVINVDQFERELPKILHMAKNLETYPTHDQEMLGRYSSRKTSKMYKLLPIFYNWKTYWGLEPSDFSQVKIVHLHGPKVGNYLEEMSTCNVTILSPTFVFPDYIKLLNQGICCDQGRTSQWAIETTNKLQAPIEDLCEVKK